MASNTGGGMPPNLNQMIANMSPEQQRQLASMLSGGAPAQTTGEIAAASRDRSDTTRAQAVFKALRGDVFGRLPRQELADALLQFRFLHESGCEMLRTLEILSNSRHPLVARIFDEVRNDVENGASLGDAFGRHEVHVGRVVVSTIRAAEESGTLADSLQFLADNIHQDEEVRLRVRRALSYPLTTAAFTVIVFVLSVMFVVPEFHTLTDRLGTQEGGVTRFMVGLSNFLRGFFWLWVPGLIIGGILAVRWWRSSPEVLDRMLLRIPLVSRLVTMSDLSRFADRLGILLKAGLPLVKAIHLAKETVSNTVLRPLFARMATQAETGRPLADAFVDIKNAPEGVVDMIRVGEDAGALPDTLTIGAANIRREMDRLYDTLTRWLQPIGILVVSVLVLLLVIALFMPYLEMLESISTQGVNSGPIGQ